MLSLIIALLPVGFILLLSEYLWRRRVIKGERARKFIHILAGIWMAFWPFYIPFDGIFVLGSMAATLLVYSRVTNLFHSIYAVKRRTYGDIIYAFGVIACAYFADADWIFTVSILILAVADGGAAVAGRFWGLKNQYYVFGKKSLRKSVIGTSVYIMLVYASLVVGTFIGGREVLNNNLAQSILVLPFVATILENTMPYGIDNLATPLFTTFILNSLS